MAILGALAGLRLLRWVLRIVIWTILAVFVYFLITGAQVWMTGRRYDPRPAKAIVVLGSAQYDGVPSPDLASRLQEALLLWHDKDAPTVMVTGGKESSDRFTEAGASARYLEDHGVPSDDIMTASGRDTWQSLDLAAPELRARGDSTVLLVTDPFHEDRSLAIAKDVGLVAYPTPTHSSPIKGWSTLPYYAKETVGVALGRIVGFDHLGWLHAEAGDGPGPGLVRR